MGFRLSKEKNRKNSEKERVSVAGLGAGLGGKG